MDREDADAATSTGDEKRRVNKKTSNGPKRLRLRTAGARPAAMQLQDQQGPKKKAEELESSGPQILRFTCSQCGDGSPFLHKDYTRHFEEQHRGIPPVFSCPLCPFSSLSFSYLQVHLFSHKDTFSGCSICEDEVKRTWAQLQAHLTSQHCSRGKYLCEICQKFCTGDVGVFLEHILLHDLNVEGADDRVFLRVKSRRGPKPRQSFCCQHCGYEASQKWLIMKHVEAVHACQNASQRRRKVEGHSTAWKPNDTVPTVKARVTRSAVRDMCWLTEDCLSLPGRDFLETYCHLSDPQTTLQETQQFLMKSVAGETGERKWTKALQTVLSNVPQDVSLFAKSDNGIMSNSSDLTVLTVKNKITVGQNTATYTKRLRMMSSLDKESVSDESANQNDCLSSENNLTPGNKVEVAAPVPSQPPGSSPTQENGENWKTDPEERLERTQQSDGTHVTRDLKLTHESRVEAISSALPNTRRPTQRRKQKARFKKSDRKSSSVALRIVLKKSAVEQQWVSQSSGVAAVDDRHKLQVSLTAGTVQVVQNASTAAAQQKKWTKGYRANLPLEAVGSILQSEAERESESRHSPVDSPSMNLQTLDGTETPLPSSEPDAHQSRSSGRTSLQRLRADSEHSPGHQCSSHQEAPPTDGAAQPVITVPGEAAAANGCLVFPAEPMKAVEDTANDGPSPKAPWWPAPKSLERTLKLVARSRVQRVKRPAGDQPVVVLNHPDVETPEVSRIMAVVNRYRGEVKKVVLSRRTLHALRASGGEAPELLGGGGPENPVQERFVLKMKLRRLDRKKYQIVAALSPRPGDEDHAPPPRRRLLSAAGSAAGASAGRRRGCCTDGATWWSGRIQAVKSGRVRLTGWKRRS